MMILRRKLYSVSKKTDYTSLDPTSAYIAKWRRRNDSGVKKEIKSIDKQTSGLENSATSIIGAVSKSQIRKKKAEIRKAGNELKLKTLVR